MTVESYIGNCSSQYRFTARTKYDKKHCVKSNHFEKHCKDRAVVSLSKAIKRGLEEFRVGFEVKFVFLYGRL